MVMNQTIRLSAFATPGTERTRCTAVSGNVCAKSMFGVFFDVTQRSASMCSIVIEALSRRPRKRPTWTNTSVTAKATPETVIRKRSLSWRRLFVARSTMASPRAFREAADHDLDELPRRLTDVFPRHPAVVALGDLERDHAVRARPHHLRHGVGV